MILHNDITDITLREKLRDQSITFAGNVLAKIYGTLKCKSGKRLQKQNRVFFSSEDEAITGGFRPCGSCMHGAYKKWKSENIKS